MVQESDNVTTTRRVIQAMSDFDFDTVHELVTDDIVVSQPFAAMGQPEQYQGRAAFVGGVRFVPTIFSEFKLDIKAIYDCPDEDAVVFEQVSHGRFVVDGSPYANRYLMIFEFRSGKISAWKEHYDPRIMTEVMTPVMAKMAQKS